MAYIEKDSKGKITLIFDELTSEYDKVMLEQTTFNFKNKYIVAKYPEHRYDWNVWFVYQFEPEFKHIAEFPYGSKMEHSSQEALDLAREYVIYLVKKNNDLTSL